MAKYGINLNIDVTNISKEHLFNGKKGTYLSATVFVDVDNQDQHGNNGMITQEWKDAPKGQTPILGNAKVFWRDSGQQSKPQQSRPQQQAPKPVPDFDDDLDSIPF